MEFDGFDKGVYYGEEHQYKLRTCAAEIWWVDVYTNICFNEEVGSWNFKTEAEAVAFIEGYELGTGAEKLPEFESCEDE